MISSLKMGRKKNVCMEWNAERGFFSLNKMIGGQQ